MSPDTAKGSQFGGGRSPVPGTQNWGCDGKSQGQDKPGLLCVGSGSGCLVGGAPQRSQNGGWENWEPSLRVPGTPGKVCLSPEVLGNIARLCLAKKKEKKIKSTHKSTTLTGSAIFERLLDVRPLA